jgi:predicted Zn-dependent peptidase
MLARAKELGTKSCENAQLEAARTSVIEHLVTSVASPPEFADSLARFASLRLEPDTTEKTIDAVRAVTAEQVKTAVGVHVRDGHLVVAVVGDATQIADSMARLGDVAVLDPSQDFARKRTVPAAGH